MSVGRVTRRAVAGRTVTGRAAVEMGRADAGAAAGCVGESPGERWRAGRSPAARAWSQQAQVPQPGRTAAVGIGGATVARRGAFAPAAAGRQGRGLHGPRPFRAGLRRNGGWAAGRWMIGKRLRPNLRTTCSGVAKVRFRPRWPTFVITARGLPRGRAAPLRIAPPADLARNGACGDPRLQIMFCRRMPIRRARWLPWRHRTTGYAVLEGQLMQQPATFQGPRRGRAARRPARPGTSRGGLALPPARPESGRRMNA